jgi:hypothetical protein
MKQQNHTYDRWWEKFGLTKNPYVYGPMPWKKTSHRARMLEARQNGWLAWIWKDGDEARRFHGYN